MVVYEAVASHELPRFDPTKMVKDVLFSPANARLVSRVLRKHTGLFTSSYFLGTALFPVVLLAPTRIAQYVAVVETVLEVPAYALAVLTLRADLVVVLVSLYDYWFFTSMILVFVVSLSLVMRDLRVVLIASRFIGFQLPILIDANVSKATSMLAAVLVNIVLTAVALAAVSLDAVPDVTHAGDLYESTRRSLSVRDLLANALFTMGILLLRIVIRKYNVSIGTKTKSTASSATGGPAPVDSEPSVSTIQCVTIRCWLKLQSVEPPSCGRSLHARQATARSFNSVRLRHSASSIQYDSTDIVLPSLVPVSLSPRVCLLVHCVGILGVLLTFACLTTVFVTSHASTTPLLMALSAGAVLSTGSYLGVLFLFKNRRLVVSVVLSFDYLFLAFQTLLAHACVCDMLRWRLVPTAVNVCCWLWFHWVLTLDALTPDMKKRLHFSHSRQIAVAFLVLYLLTQIIAIVAGVYWETWQLQNRAVLNTKLLGHHLEFRVLPFFVSRMLTVTVWTVRLIWRFRHQDDPNKLIMLRGQVEFDYEPHVRPSVLVRLMSIMPMPPKGLQQNRREVDGSVAKTPSS